MNSILLRLTRLHMRLIGGRFVRSQIMKTPDSIEQEVAIFSGDKAMFLGQFTPFRTIIINESVLRDERLSNSVLIHEMAHKKQWWSYLAIPLLPLVLYGFLSLTWAIVLLILSLTSMNPSYLLRVALYVGLSLLAFVVPCGFSWALEMNADLTAIRQMGLKAFQEIRDDLRRTRRLPWSSRVIDWLTHPPVGLTVRVWRWRHKQEKA